MMYQSYIILSIILILSLLIKNNSLVIASLILISFKLFKLNYLISKFENNGLKIGIIVLTIGILSPIAQDKYTIKDIISSIKSPIWIISIIVSILIIILTKNGYNLLSTEPVIILPIILGTIIGLIIFKGIPVGPLVSAGITVFIYSIYKFVVH